MKLTAADGTSFSLFATDYQFPNSTEDEYDSNWIYVTVNVAGFDQPWTSNDPSLMTWELKSLANWLTSILPVANGENEIRFIEPNLRFQLVGRENDRLIIRTSLALESKPAWWEEDGAFSFDMEIDEQQIKHAVESLRFQLEKFPRRGGTVIQ